MELVNITINNQEVKNINLKNNLLDILAFNNIELPRFCYHEELMIAGNCRMCIVEIKGINKPIVACATLPSPKSEIYSYTKLVKNARESVLEFLLINHPLDCPVCDQGGECDLQDQAYVFGNDRGRFHEEKRATLNTFCSPIVKMILTRCIHCTRCVRFFQEVAGRSFFGMVSRGNNMKISNYSSKKFLNFELSGNVTDLCPVGALTFKPAAFKGRVWEYESGYFFDFFDTYCANIKIDYKNNFELLRITPLVNSENSWISDKIRACYSVFNLTKKRYKEPYVLDISNKFYYKITWENAFKNLTKKISHYKNKLIFLNFMLGNFLDLKNLFYLKKFSQQLKITNTSIKSLIFYEPLLETNTDVKNVYKNIIKNKELLFNNLLSILALKKINTLTIINSNLRFEMPLLNYQIKKYTNFDKQFNIFIFNDVINHHFNYKFFHGGTCLKSLVYFFKGNSWFCNKITNYYFSKKKNNKINFVINGLTLVTYYENALLYNLKLFDDLNFWNFSKTISKVLNFNVTILNSLFLNVSNKNYHLSIENLTRFNKLNYLININPNILQKENTLNKINKNMLVYQSSSIDLDFFLLKKNKFKYLLPTKNILEYDCISLNFSGILKKFMKIIPFKYSKSHNDIFLTLFLFQKSDLKFHSLFWHSYEDYYNYIIKHYSLDKIKIETQIWFKQKKKLTSIKLNINTLKKKLLLLEKYEIRNQFFQNMKLSFYDRDIISQKCKTLQYCSGLFKKDFIFKKW